MLGYNIDSRTTDVMKADLQIAAAVPESQPTSRAEPDGRLTPPTPQDDQRGPTPTNHRETQLYLGKHAFQAAPENVEGSPITLNGEDFYRIANYDRMRPFFMTLVSSSDHWMFISSTGALTAGRANPDLALFPYVDR